MAKETKKKTKIIVTDADKKLEETMKRYIGGLFEQFDHRALLVKEHHDGQFEKMQRTFDSHTKMLKTHSESIANLTMDMLELKSDVRDIKLQVKINLPNKVDKKHFVELEGRVRTLEKK